MAIGRANFELKRGSTFRQTINWKNSDGTAVDLTGYTAKMQIRPTPDSATIHKTLDSTAGDGTITITAATGKVDLKISASDTGVFTWQTAVYDLLLTDAGGIKTCLLDGTITVVPRITQ